MPGSDSGLGLPPTVIVQAWAPWCHHCEVMGPALEAVSAEFSGRVPLVRLNVDRHPRQAAARGVKGIPTLIAYRDGHEIARRVGRQNRAELRALFAALDGTGAVIRRVSPTDRILRSVAGASLIAAGIVIGGSIPLIALGTIVLGAGWWDRLFSP